MLYLNEITKEMIEVSLIQDGDFYNKDGINISTQERRQNLIKWKTIRYRKKKKSKL